ncbi:MAG TPA: hypothetical protein VFB65_04215 [Pyrinomonadaceae bacterium]|nr:hypothetical protein [Pyrinomonadaceae bacterium]
MAHDRMNDDLDRNMGRAGQEDEFGGGQDFGQQTPGRNPGQGQGQQGQQGQGQSQQTGQKGAGQKNNPLEDDDFGGGGGQSGQSGSQGRMGGQNR